MIELHLLRHIKSAPSYVSPNFPQVRFRSVDDMLRNLSHQKELTVASGDQNSFFFCFWAKSEALQIHQENLLECE